MMKNLSAVIIGSRANRHLKTPIPLLPFGGSTVLNRTLSAYVEARFSEILLVVAHRGPEIQASLGPLGDKVQVVVAPSPDEEYGGLLRRGIERLSSSAKAFAIGLGDQPLLTKELLGELAGHFATAKPKILVPVCQGLLGHPVFFEIGLAADFKKLPPTGEVWDVLKEHKDEVLDLGLYHTAVIRHIEDMEDYHTLLQMAGLPVPEPARGAPGNGGAPEAGPAAKADPGAMGSVGRIEPL